jgi:hypothetical protein
LLVSINGKLVRDEHPRHINEKALTFLVSSNGRLAREEQSKKVD